MDILYSPVRKGTILDMLEHLLAHQLAMVSTANRPIDQLSFSGREE